MSFPVRKPVTERRAEAREDVFYRTQAAGSDGHFVRLVLVNLSPRGFMARVDGDWADGEAIRVRLPVIGTVAATMRWSLGGRMGCEFDTVVSVDDWPRVLEAVLQGRSATDSA